MNPGTVRKVALVAALLALTLFVLPTTMAQSDPSDTTAETAIKDRTMAGEPVTPSGDIIGPIYEKIIWTSVAVFLLVAIIMVYIIVRFRHKPGRKVDVPQIHGNSKMEIAWTIGPALVMFWLLVISYNGLLAIDNPGEEPEVYVDVTASRFLWTFEYADGSEASGRLADGTSPILRLQEDTWIQLNVTSSDVIHAIRVPGLDVMIDANPGRMNHVMFYAREPGVYLVQCFQFCGTGHGEMIAAVEIFEKGTQARPYGDAEAAPPTGTGGDVEEPTIDPSTLPPADMEVEMTAFDYGFDPVPVDAEPGDVVRIHLINDGPSPHNVFVGEYDWQAHQGNAACEPPAANGTGVDDCWASSTIGTGADTYLQFTVPEEPQGFSLWCDVPGHAQAGMLSYLSVGGEAPEGAAEGQVQPRLPAPSAALVVVALGAIAVFLGRRRL